MRILCTSDLHGNLIPKNQIPKCDLILIAGDLCPTWDHNIYFQEHWLNNEFNNWCASLDAPVVCCAGNHDFAYEKIPHRILNKDYIYLHEKEYIFNRLKIYGLNWQRRFHDWAFNLDEPQLAEKWQLIPSDTDIIMCHGPAYGYGDSVLSRKGDEEKWPEVECVGSPSMLNRIDEIKPKLYVCGHIHSGYGVKYHHVDDYRVTMVNASYVNQQYKPVNEPIIVNL